MTIDEMIKSFEVEAADLRSTAALWKSLADEKGLGLPSDYPYVIEDAEKWEQLIEWLKDYKRLLKEQRTQGKWIVKTISTFPQYQPDEYICPFCNTIVNHKTNFCSNCGADMRGEE